MSKVRRRFQFGMSSLVLLMTVACVGVGIYQMWPSPKVDVLVATDHLDFRTKITKTNVKFQTWPAEIVPEGAITSAEGIPKGKYIMTRLRKGQAVLADDVLAQSEIPSFAIPPGYKIINVKIPIYEGSCGLLRPGDRVDVIAVGLDGTEESTRTILKNARVFNIGSSVNPQVMGIVGLLVTEKQATTISEAKAIGKLELALQ